MIVWSGKEIPKKEMLFLWPMKSGHSTKKSYYFLVSNDGALWSRDIDGAVEATARENQRTADLARRTLKSDEIRRLFEMWLSRKNC